MADPLGGVVLQRPAANGHLHALASVRHILLRADRRRSVRPRPDCGSMVQPGGICESSERHHDRPDRLQPARGHPRSPDWTGAETAGSRLRKTDLDRPLAAAGDSWRSVQRDEYAVVPAAGQRVAQLQRHAKLRHDHADAQHAAPVPGGRKDLLVESRLGRTALLALAMLMPARVEPAASQISATPPDPAQIERQLTDAVQAAPDSFNAHHALAGFYL